MDPLTIATLASVGLVAVGTRWFVQRFADFRTPRRRLRRSRSRPTGSVEDGTEVKIIGAIQAIGGETLEAPVGGATCVAYRVRVFALDGDGPHKLYEDEQTVAFRLEAEDGRARIDGPIRFADAPALALEHNGEGPLPEPFKRLLERSSDLPVPVTMVIEQAVLEVGARAAALGRAQRVVDPERAGADYRVPATELVLGALRDGPVIAGTVD